MANWTDGRSFGRRQLSNEKGIRRAQAVSERSISFMVSLCDLEESTPPIGNPNRARSFRERSLESDQQSWHPKFGLLAITAPRSRSGKAVRKSRIPNRDDTKARNCQPNPKNPMRIMTSREGVKCRRTLHWFTNETALRTLKDPGIGAGLFLSSSGPTRLDQRCCKKRWVFAERSLSAIHRDLVVRVLGGF
jgi:hypothetical protein